MGKSVRNLASILDPVAFQSLWFHVLPELDEEFGLTKLREM